MNIQVNPLRIKKLSDVTYSSGTVMYQMCRDIRARDNDALLFAQQLAQQHGAQLIVNYPIWNYEWEGATRRFYDWVLPSLQEVEAELRAHNIPLMVTFVEKDSVPSAILPHIGVVVIDQLPLRFMKKWKHDFLLHHKNAPLYEVDAHNCIPVWETSQKQEFAARTIRGKVHTLLPQFLQEHGKLQIHHENQELLKAIAAINWNDIRSRIKCDESVSGTGEFVPATQAGQKILTNFLHHKLTRYDSARNDFTIDGSSNLSPYISHGNISRRSIMLQLLEVTNLKIEDAFDSVKNGSNGTMGSVAAFIEECVVRAELCDNYCYYNKEYDTVKGFPAWAQETLGKARTDTREYIYSLQEFKFASTHDDIWNAAQLQMVATGKMHGYLRMYWAKKILEWTTTPEDAMKISVYLNDTYELDGRDPGGYVGCGWSIGGVHDRPWFGRPIFGAIRYMARSGVEKRGNIQEYIDKWVKTTGKVF